MLGAAPGTNAAKACRGTCFRSLTPMVILASLLNLAILILRRESCQAWCAARQKRGKGVWEPLFGPVCGAPDGLCIPWPQVISEPPQRPPLSPQCFPKMPR